jgi:FixJ family two-component response regulator
MQGDKDECMSRGMDHYISKPVTIKALTDALKRAYNHTHTNNTDNNNKVAHNQQKTLA